MLAMGRALMTKPRMLLLDEPSMGLAPQLVEYIFETIQRIHDEGAAILLVEQNAAQALTIATRGYVLQTGQILMSDSAAGLAANEDVRRAYLGETRLTHRAVRTLRRASSDEAFAPAPGLAAGPGRGVWSALASASWLCPSAGRTLAPWTLKAG